MARLTTGDRLSMNLRSLWLMSSWSFEGMQGVGFSHAIQPALERLHEGEELRESYRRHSGFFNTHPFMASAVLGCVARLEEEGERGRSRIAKKTLMGVYGAMGDGFFWGGLKPFGSVVAAAAVLGGLYWAPWLFIAGFAAVSLVSRYLFLGWGYELGQGVVEKINSLNLLRRARYLKLATSAGLGVLLMLAHTSGLWEPFGLPPVLAVTAAGFGALVFSLVPSRGIGAGWLVLGVTVGAFMAIHVI